MVRCSVLLYFSVVSCRIIFFLFFVKTPKTMTFITILSKIKCLVLHLLTPKHDILQGLTLSRVEVSNTVLLAITTSTVTKWVRRFAVIDGRFIPEMWCWKKNRIGYRIHDLAHQNIRSNYSAIAGDPSKNEKLFYCHFVFFFTTLMPSMLSLIWCNHFPNSFLSTIWQRIMKWWLMPSVRKHSYEPQIFCKKPDRIYDFLFLYE